MGLTPTQATTWSCWDCSVNRILAGYYRVTIVLEYLKSSHGEAAVWESGLCWYAEPGPGLAAALHTGVNILCGQSAQGNVCGGELDKWEIMIHQGPDVLPTYHHHDNFVN